MNAHLTFRALLNHLADGEGVRIMKTANGFEAQILRNETEPMMSHKASHALPSMAAAEAVSHWLAVRS